MTRLQSRAVIAAGGFDRLPLCRVVPLPAVDCLICGESMGREDGQVHAECERKVEEYDAFFNRFTQGVTP